MNKLVYLLLSCVLLTSCTANQTMKSDIAKLQRSVTDMRSFQSEQTSEIDSIRNELRGLVGRLENLEYIQRAQLGGSPTALVDNANSLRKKTPPPIVPVEALEEDEVYLTTAQGNPEALKRFSDALRFIREGKFQEALPLLQEAASMNGNAEGTIQMIFWRGVACEGISDHICALGAYGQIVSLQAPHFRKPLALLRQGSVFLRMGDSKTAELTYRKLINDYPTSREASLAKEKLGDLR